MDYRLLRCTAAVAVVGLGTALPVGTAESRGEGADGGPPARTVRWAVLTAADVRATGLGDLLTALLTEEHGIELVERDQLDAIEAELNVDALFGAAAAADRLRFGMQLQADALVLLAFVAETEPVAPPPRGTDERQDGRRLRLIVAECRYGARLGVGSFAFEAGETARLAEEIAGRVAQLHRRHGRRTERVYAVTPFVSKSLRHTHDHLQSGYAFLLQETLLATPGTACLELEEAQAIDREVRLGRGELADRHVPLFVEGEFEVPEVPGPDPPGVHLAIRVVGGEAELVRLERQADSFDEAVDWLTGEAARAIGRAAEHILTPIDRPRQKAMIIRRAEEFERYALWQQAAGLREAALLLDPGDTEVQIALIGAYGRLLAARAPRITGSGHDEQAQLPRWKAIYAEQFAIWQMLAHHVERVIARGEVNPREASLLVDVAYDAVGSVKPLALPHTEELKQRRHDLFRTAYGHFPRLDPTLGKGRIREVVSRATRIGRPSGQADESYSPEEIRELWVRDAVNRCLRSALDFTFVEKNVVRYKLDDTHTLDDIHFLLTRAVPPDTPPVQALAGIIAPNDFRVVGLMLYVSQGRFTAGEVRALFDRLEASGTDANVFYAKAGKVALDTFFGNDGQSDLSPETDRRIEALIAHVEEQGYTQTVLPKQRGFASHAKDMLRMVGVYRKQEQQRVARRAPRDTETPLKAKRHVGPPASPYPRFDLEPRVGFEPIDWIATDLEGFAPGGPSLDVAWSRTEVFAVAEKGAVQRVFRIRAVSPNPADAILDVKCDGTVIWIATRRSGVWAVSPRGELLGNAAANDDLPPYTLHAYNQYLFIEPIEPGKCLALGTFGRVWFAALTLGRSAGGSRGLEVEVVYQATESADGDAPGPLPIDRRFPLQWVRRERSADAEREYLIVGERRPPLRIDLPSLDISAFDEPYPPFTGLAMRSAWRHFVRARDGFLRLSPQGIEFAAPSENEAEPWNFRPLSETAARRPEHQGLIAHRGAVYCRGDRWRRIDPETLEVVDLSDDLLPLWHRYTNIAESAHYGLVVWNGASSGAAAPYRRMHRVVLPPETLPQHAVFSHVPPEAREKHAQALRTLWQQGAQAGPRSEADCRTAVRLDANWQGGDDDLAVLRDLYDLQLLSLQGVPITNRGLKHLEGLPIAELHLYETRVTDDGLDSLATMPALRTLWLEGTVRGNEFSDAGLRKLTELPIAYLTLYGRGFTDATADLLPAFSSLVRVTHADTAITDAAIERVQARSDGRPKFLEQHRR